MAIHQVKKIYTVFKDEAIDYEPFQECLMSFDTKEAAINYLNGLVGDVKTFWKTLGKFEDMEIDDSVPYYFDIYKPFNKDKYHTTLSIFEHEYCQS